MCMHACMRRHAAAGAHAGQGRRGPSNEEAIRFYAKFGFGISDTVPGYYAKKRLQPPDAHVLSKSLVS